MTFVFQFYEKNCKFCHFYGVIKLITSVSYECSQLAKLLVPDRLFQPSLMFVSEAGAYPSEAPFTMISQRHLRYIEIINKLKTIDI